MASVRAPPGTIWIHVKTCGSGPFLSTMFETHLDNTLAHLRRAIATRLNVEPDRLRLVRAARNLHPLTLTVHEAGIIGESTVHVLFRDDLEVRGS